MAKQISKTHTESISKKVSGERYFEAVGRRKTAIARVRIFANQTGFGITVNDKILKDYFPLKKYQDIASAAFKILAIKDNFKTLVKVKGGGVNAQAEAIRLGSARALIILNPEWRGTLKKFGYLRRDPRKVERKKFGLRKARRPQQWRKR